MACESFLELFYDIGILSNLDQGIFSWFHEKLNILLRKQAVIIPIPIKNCVLV
jgi:hypothetical protein